MVYGKGLYMVRDRALNFIHALSMILDFTTCNNYRLLHLFLLPWDAGSNENFVVIAVYKSCTEIASVHLAGAFQEPAGTNWFPYFGPSILWIQPKKQSSLKDMPHKSTLKITETFYARESDFLHVEMYFTFAECFKATYFTLQH